MGETMDETPSAGSVLAPEQSAESARAGRRAEQSAIDIEALAEKVYRLMLAEIRLDRARGLASEDGR